MNYAHRIPMTLRICSRACSAALATMVVALSTCGAANPPPPGPAAASTVESAAPPAGRTLAPPTSEHVS